MGYGGLNTRFSLSMEMSKLTRDETAEPVSRDQILRRERGHGVPDYSSEVIEINRNLFYGRLIILYTPRPGG